MEHFQNNVSHCEHPQQHYMTTSQDSDHLEKSPCATQFTVPSTHAGSCVHHHGSIISAYEAGSWHIWKGSIRPEEVLSSADKPSQTDVREET